MNSAELFVKCLENEGVSFIFGLPGEENSSLMIALEDSSIRFILCRHEQGAAFMANVYGRLTGRPGVCLSTLGPGATNLITGVADANMDRVPLVAITAQADSHRIHKESHQNQDLLSLFKPITKYSHQILHPDSIPEITRKAFKTAIQEKPGACHIELPCDIAELEAPLYLKPLNPLNPARPEPNLEAISSAVAMITSAKRPVILAGNGVIREDSYKELRAFAEKTGIGVISTFMAKGAIARDCDQCLFTIGLPAKDHEWFILNEADVVIAAGYDLVEYLPSLWNPLDSYPKKKILHIDFLPAETDSCYQPDIEIIGDIASTFSKLTLALPSSKIDYDLSFQQETRRRIINEIKTQRDVSQTGLITPHKILFETGNFLSEKDILISDVGAHKLWIARYHHTVTPKKCIIPNGFCPMGFALPGAIGAKIACPDQRVLAICGDGGFMMNLQELETAARINANIVVMIWEDKEFGLIRWKQNRSFGHHTDLHFNNPDFVELARAFDCHGARINDSREIVPALERAFNCGRPAVIAIPVDYSENMKLF